jgi:hypothetical protein
VECPDGPSTFAWADQAVKRIIRQNILPENEIVASLVGAKYTLSSCFSGIGCFDLAAMMSSDALNCFVEYFLPDWEPGVPAMTLTSKYFIEKNASCRAELMATPHAQETCVFDDVELLVPPDVRAHIKTMSSQGRNADIAKYLYDNRHRYRRTMFCYTHDKKCPLTRCTFHSAGSPCVDHTQFGSRTRDNGYMHVLYSIWVVHRLVQLEDVVFHENVQGWTVSKINEDLSSAYIPLHVVLHGTDFGLSARRDRLWSCFVRKDLVEYNARGKHIFTASLMYELIRKSLFRHVKHDMFDFLFEDDAGVAVELLWALRRPGSKARVASIKALHMQRGCN